MWGCRLFSFALLRARAGGDGVDLPGGTSGCCTSNLSLLLAALEGPRAVATVDVLLERLLRCQHNRE